MLAALFFGCSSGGGKGNQGWGGQYGGNTGSFGGQGGGWTPSGGAGSRGDAGIAAGSGHETFLLKMESVQGVSKNPPVPTIFTLASASYVTRVWTYHYSATIGGKSPTISFKDTTTGVVHGPWPQTGYKSINSGLDAAMSDPGHIPGPPDNYWMAYPATVIPAGTYQVIDSEPATWAYTSDLGNRGVTWIYGWAGGPPAVDAGSDAPSGASGISVAYTRGELAGQTALDEQLTPLIDKTAAALIQAVFTINSFLFTDPAVTSFAALQTRKAEADQALDVLAKHAAATESLIGTYLPDQGDGGVKGGDAGAIDAGALQPVRLKGLTPEEVMATLSSGPSTAQIKTLMNAYNVSAKRAQLILNTAMAGLDAQAWNDEAKSMDTLMRQATVVKESAKLGFVIVGTAVTAGGVSGALSVAQGAKAIVSGTKGVIAVSKAGAELIMGKDLVIKEGSKESLVMTTVDTVSDIIAIGRFQKILTGTATVMDKLKGIATIASKVNNAFENKTITFGELKVDIKDGLSIGSSIDVGYINGLLGGPTNPPSTLPGTYKINGIPSVVTTMPQDILDAISKFLPSSDLVRSVLVLITSSPTDAGTKAPDGGTGPSPDAGADSKPFDATTATDSHSDSAAFPYNRVEVLVSVQASVKYTTSTGVTPFSAGASCSYSAASGPTQCDGNALVTVSLSPDGSKVDSFTLKRDKDIYGSMGYIYHFDVAGSGLPRGVAAASLLYEAKGAQTCTALTKFTATKTSASVPEAPEMLGYTCDAASQAYIIFSKS
jgi:hypothetical protein